MLNYKDSERESVISYLEDPDSIIKNNFVDTPTRLVNHSNEFLGQVKKINQDKLSKKKQELKNIRNFKELGDISDIEKSQKSTFRRQEQEKRDMLFKIVNNDDIEQISLEIQHQIVQNIKQKGRVSIEAGRKYQVGDKAKGMISKSLQQPNPVKTTHKRY